MQPNHLASAAPGARETPHPSDEERIRHLVFRELSRTGTSLLGFRFGAVTVLLSITILFAVLDPGGFQVWVLLGVTLFGLAVALRPPHADTQRSGVAQFFAVIFVFHTTLILVSGGIESPFVVVYIPVSVILAVVTGDRRVFLMFVVAPILAVWAFAFVHIQTPESQLLPVFFHVSTPGYSTVYWVTFATTLSLIMIVGGMLGLTIRGALDRAIGVAVQARAETLTMSQERNRELMELLGALAHELKNPLACISGLSGLVARKLPPSQKPAEQMAVVNDEIKRMGAIIEEFLNFSRPLQMLSLEWVDASTLIHDVATLHEAEALRREVELQTHVPAGIALRGDPRKLKQVLLNLTQNAIDAAPAQGTVILEVEASAERVTFTLDDDGPGFGARAGRLFTPGLTTKVGGSGLGLTIARVIVEQHGGELELSTRVGGGGRVVVSLPSNGPVDVASTEPTASLMEVS